MKTHQISSTHIDFNKIKEIIDEEQEKLKIEDIILKINNRH